MNQIQHSKSINMSRLVQTANSIDCKKSLLRSENVKTKQRVKVPAVTLTRTVRRRAVPIAASECTFINELNGSAGTAGPGLGCSESAVADVDEVVSEDKSPALSVTMLSGESRPPVVELLLMAFKIVEVDSVADEDELFSSIVATAFDVADDDDAVNDDADVAADEAI